MCDFEFLFSSRHVQSEYPTICRLNVSHNHPTQCAEALKYRKPSQQIKQQFMNFFKDGHTVATATDMYESKLEEEMGETEFYKKRCDSSLFPPYWNVYRSVITYSGS